ncbi:MAG: DUF3667 domain-containing protein [Chitinophagaceae bacterium]
MSHSKERHETNCLNCNTEVVGRYCHKCGQENIEPKESVWGLINHFFSDITHFDGKFFSTTRYLIAKPGLLPKEYISGKRASFLHPIRMYVFCSAMFFLAFYAVYQFHFNEKSFEKVGSISTEKLANAKEKALEEAQTHQDSVDIEEAFSRMDNVLGTEVAGKTDTLKTTDSTEVKKVHQKKKHNVNFVNFDDEKESYESIAAYDSAQLKLPSSKRDGWFKRIAKRRNIKLQQTYGDDQERFWHELIEKFVHSFPYLLFISLPLYAVFLKLLYVRRKQFYYTDHAIFLIYLYIFTFIFLLLYFGTMSLDDKFDWGWIAWLQVIMVLGGIYYTYKSMRTFYGQGRGKTIMKFVLFNICCCFSLILLFAVFFTVAVLRM